MKQPTKDVLREQLALAASEIIAGRREIIGLRNEIDALDWLLSNPRKPWWRRWFA